MRADIKRRKFRRVRYIVDAVFQLRYVRLMMLMMFLTAAVCAYTVYYTGIIAIADKLSSVYPQGRLVALLNTVNGKILINVALLAPIVAIVGIYISHKIAGPLFRLERHLGDMACGNLSSKLVFRKGDEMLQIADKLNIFTDTIKGTLKRQGISLENISKKIDDHRKGGNRDVAGLLESIDKEMMSIKSELNRYKI